MGVYKLADRSPIQPNEITCTGYLPMGIQPLFESQKQTLWQRIIGRKNKIPTGRFYANGWLETDDKMGYLRPHDVILIGKTYDDPLGEKMFIKLLTSYNNMIRTYEVQSLMPIRSTDFKGKKVFKLFVAMS